MKLFYSVNRLLVLLLTVSFLISPPSSFSQTALTFTSIPVSDPDLVAPGRGAEQWHDRTDVNIPVEGTNTRPMDVYYRFVATRISTAQKAYITSPILTICSMMLSMQAKTLLWYHDMLPGWCTDVGLVAYDGGTGCYPIVVTPADAIGKCKRLAYRFNMDAKL
jgi:hypothetical protein